MITVRGHELRVSTHRGEGLGPPLLMCNGLGSSLEALAPLATSLGPGREVIRFDVPGVGFSAAPMLPYSMPQMARLVVGLLDRLDCERVDVLGYSWGGVLAQQMAFQHPGRCRRLVLASTMPGLLGLPGSPQAIAAMLTPRRFFDREYAERVAGDLYGGTVSGDPRLVDETVLGANGSPRGYLYQLLAGVGWTSIPWLPLIRHDTLILSGDDDPIIPVANAELMHRLLPHSTLHLHAGGHLALVTEAADLAPVVEEFLDAA